MVGNDVDQDLPAGQAGMRTFLASGYLLDRGRTGGTPDASGSLGDLALELGLW